MVIHTEVEIFYQDLHTKTLESAQQSDWYHFTVIEIRWFLFAERLADASAERLSTMSSPYMVLTKFLLTSESFTKRARGMKKNGFRHYFIS